ncbi:Chitobiosyldiphosphodolichol beta-mannosyltransferase, partial [Globisporangium splendens]
MATDTRVRRRNGKSAGAKRGSNNNSSTPAKQRHAVVMVLGDVGRSPRMQYHALSLAQLENVRVSLVGYAGERCIPELYAQPNVHFLTFTPRMQRISRKFFMLLAPIKVVVQGSKFVIDWHNLGYSILALSLGSKHPLVKLATWIERVFGRKADANLCVTKVMQEWLEDTWQIQATVLHDKPPLFFKPTPVEAQHDLFLRVGDQIRHCNDVRYLRTVLVTGYTLTGGSGKKKKTDDIVHREERPAMIISSTSWTADEDFGILLHALTLLDKQTATMAVTEFPNLLVVVTGKGPQKEMYLERIRQLAFKRIRIATMWLEASDYPLVLGSADLGVCLHTSSSGLDLPMKVLDMFGCGVPVCAVGFKCLDELVQHEKNGLVFDSSEMLAAQFFELLKGYPTNAAKLNRLRAALTKVETKALTMATKNAASPLAISPEEKLAMPLADRASARRSSRCYRIDYVEGAHAHLVFVDALWLLTDALIKNSKKANNTKPAKAGAKPNASGKIAKAKKQFAADVAGSKKKAKKSSHQQQNVKKTVTVKVSKAARARATTAASSSKRQEVINKHRPGLVITKPKQTKRGAGVTVQVRKQKISALRVKATPVTAAGKKRQQQQKAKSTLDVSNIERHFRLHPKKFTIPEGKGFTVTFSADSVATLGDRDREQIHSTRTECVIMSDASEISSLEEIESLASSDAEVQVSPFLRRYSHERAAASAMPESFDRLRQLQTHMKQLQKLYDQELHLEELARRDAFVQMICTSSITLFRHCVSRSRFYTAVKALMCQYLPARNAKLIQVERSNDKSYLVLQSNQSFQIAEGDATGMAGDVVNAMCLTSDRNKYAQDLSASSGSSVVSLTRTSEGPTFNSHWLETHEDRILPSTNGHLLLLLPLQSIHQTDLHHEIDLISKKKDIDDGAQLLVMGLKNASGASIGIVEAILPDASTCNMEFLDAFGALLATALESRLAMCRSVVENVHIRVVDFEFAECGDSATDQNGLQSCQPMLTVPLLGNVGRIEAFGEASIFSEHDQDLLQAFEQPVSHLCKLNREFRGRSLIFENSLHGFQELWSKWATSPKLSESSKWKLLRELFLDFGTRIVGSTSLEANEPSPQLRLLFRGETKEMHRRAYGDSVDSESDDSGRSALFSIDGQFSILQQVMISNESFESGDTVTATPIRCRSDWAEERDTPNGSQAIASMILILLNLSVAESRES